jgi:hypothetical protein
LVKKDEQWIQELQDLQELKEDILLRGGSLQVGWALKGRKSLG